AGFWNQVRREAIALRPNDDPEAATKRLAAKMIGRWESGAPLVLNEHSDPDNGVPQPIVENNFQYAEQDPAGFRCPVGAHIRRASPRDALPPDRRVALDSANRHRLLRRGRSYGDYIGEGFAARFVDDGKRRGLHFMCLNADLERQFEFVQQTWLNNP